MNSSVPSLSAKEPKMESSATKRNRKPLQPKNLNSILASEPKPNPKEDAIQPLIRVDAGKENRPIHTAEPREASLAEELEVIRKRRERLRIERKKTERVLKERDLVLERVMREMERRVEEQRRIELEIQRLIGFEELISICTKLSPVQSLRAKEEERRSREEQSQESSTSDMLIKEVADLSNVHEQEAAI
ncbi:uncharacterized protein [Typha angustifolia]|uniref:uncharacterized protein n=1 Tax=Typha angustifolia TaxID=59011 RepID=UPI003C2C4D46